MSLLVLLLIASSVVPGHLMVLDELKPNGIRPGNIQVGNVSVTVIVSMSIIISSIINLIYEMLSH